MRIEAVVEAEGILAAVEKALAVDAALLEEGEGARIVAAVEALSAAIGGSDRKAVADLSQALDAVTAPFAQRRIERDLTRALSGRGADEVGSALGLKDRAPAPAATEA
jgi:molecular chaperone HscA